MAADLGPSGREPERAPRIAALLLRVASPLALVGIFVGAPGRYTHHTLYSPARILFIPSGCLFLIAAAICWRSGARRSALVTLLFGLGLVGIGLHKVAAGPWALLAVPGSLAVAAWFLRTAIRGPGDPLFDRLRRRAGRGGGSRSITTTRLFALFGVCMGAFGVWASILGRLPH